VFSWKEAKGEGRSKGKLSGDGEPLGRPDGSFGLLSSRPLRNRERSKPWQWPILKND